MLEAFHESALFLMPTRPAPRTRTMFVRIYEGLGAAGATVEVTITP